jgi:RimJ/RimL family protein N-acetyltransferase
MELHDLYQLPELWTIPYQLLQEREPSQNISHKTMPTWDEHQAFIKSHPYKAWYVFRTPMGEPAGCVYLTRNREIGIFVLKKHQGQGLATQAITEIMRLHPGRILANINPANETSIRLFAKFGFRHIQNTYALDPK